MSTTSEAADRVHGAVERVSRGAHQAVDRIAERATPAVEQVRSAAERASDMVDSGINELSTIQGEWVGSMRERVRDRPLAVVGLAVLVGVVLGRLMR